MKNFLTALTIFVSAQAFSQTDSSTYFYQKGVEEKTAKRFLAASKNFDKAIKLNPQYTAAYIDNGYANLEMRKMDVAIASFTKANELEPANNVAIGELMNLYFSYRQYAKAIEFAQKCKECSNAEKITALSLYQQEDYAKAEKALLSYLGKTPADADANYALGRSYMEMEQMPNAIKYYEKAVQADGTRSQWLNELGILYYTAENYKNAVINFNKAVAAGLTVTNDFNENLGFSYLYSGEFDKGEKLLQELLSRKPGNKDLLRDIAQAFYDRKMYDKSLDYCQKLLELDAKDAQALYQAGMCFQKKGEKDRGQAMCDKAIEMDPSLAKNRKQMQMPGGL